MPNDRTPPENYEHDDDVFADADFTDNATDDTPDTTFTESDFQIAATEQPDAPTSGDDGELSSDEADSTSPTIADSGRAPRIFEDLTLSQAFGEFVRSPLRTWGALWAVADARESSHVPFMPPERRVQHDDENDDDPDDEQGRETIALAPEATDEPEETPEVTEEPTDEPEETPEPTADPTDEPSDDGNDGECSGETYNVTFGDTLFRIALRFDSTVSTLAQANGIANPNLILVGQQLCIPGDDQGSAQPFCSK